ncbi:hypothetical protein BDV96DRAFT_599701 [Lophiotrema nucula]|uniref:Heterokaryon incompatibility protein-domain-containing protein n=1 Tax=Lophiotrema nucula TaxID=690887 RepID=A0A6A5ZA89_9PLEO|nr:hypothetical protein BDV96DRAFT_599701 [Lophiotrema nucula]
MAPKAKAKASQHPTRLASMEEAGGLSASASSFRSSIAKSYKDIDILKNYNRPYQQLEHVANPYSSSERYIGGVLDVARYALCKDERDKIFGILSIAEPLADWIRPDYTKSTAQIYTELSVQSLRTRTLWLFEHTHLSISRDDAPTWVPDWAAINDIQNLSTWSRSSGRSAAVVERLSEGILRVGGVFVSEVEKSCAIQLDGSLSGQWTQACKTLSDLLPSVESLMSQESAQHNSSDEFGRVFSQGRFSEAFEPPDPDATTFAEFSNFFSKVRNDQDIYWTSYDSIGQFECISTVAHDRSLFHTSTRKVGIGPHGVLPGDIVCVFLGGRSAFILRRHATTAYFQRVGTCFVNGSMYGEALLGPLPPGWEQFNRRTTGYDVPAYRRTASRGIWQYEDPRLPVPAPGTTRHDPE